jgi:hypothetical protein
VTAAKPCIWICPRHGALPEGTRLCGTCGTEQSAFLAAQPGQITIDDELGGEAA